MGCVDRDFLQALYKKAVDDYVAVAKDLRAHALGIPHEEFMFLWHAAERAKDPFLRPALLASLRAEVIASVAMSSPICTVTLYVKRRASPKFLTTG